MAIDFFLQYAKQSLRQCLYTSQNILSIPRLDQGRRSGALSTQLYCLTIVAET